MMCNNISLVVSPSNALTLFVANHIRIRLSQDKTLRRVPRSYGRFVCVAFVDVIDKKMLFIRVKVAEETFKEFANVVMSG